MDFLFIYFIPKTNHMPKKNIIKKTQKVGPSPLDKNIKIY